jgi:hypothetical protein
MGYRVIKHNNAITGKGKAETFLVCKVCGTLVSEDETYNHDNSHRRKERKTPAYELINVKTLRAILANFSDDAEISLGVSGYEWDSAELAVIVNDHPFVIIKV